MKSTNEYDYWSELQKISYHTSFFMKPSNIIAYGFDHKNTYYNTLMVRGWLHEDNKNKLNILIMMEKFNRINLYLDKEREFYILNNPHWYPTLDFFKEKNKLKNDELIQEIKGDKYKIY